MEEYLVLKDKLLNPKKGDSFITTFYLDGYRTCQINFGSKWMIVKPLYSSINKKKFSTKNGREILRKMYWSAARTDAHYKAIESGKKRAGKNWEKNYL